MSKSHTPGSAGKGLLTVILCSLLVLFTLAVLTAVGLYSACNLVLNGPSESARDALAISLLKSDATAWIPPLFLDEQELAQIQNDGSLRPEPLPEDKQTTIQFETAPADEWANCPDGIRIETIHKSTFTAHVMLIRDPSAVYLATSSDTFDIDIQGTRILNQMRIEGAIAAINGGAFNDDGTSSSYIGSLPIGMVVSEGKILWDDGNSYLGFAGLTADHKLVVSETITPAMVKELNIRDGCCFGPILIKDGQLNEGVRDRVTSHNARTAIGQRADGTIIFLCTDGRQAGSLGSTYGATMELMQELGAINACTLDGGASTVMTYRDTYGRYGKAGNVIMCNSYALIQASPRRMPTFFMVRAPKTED